MLLPVLATALCAVLMPCLVVFGVIFLRPSNNNPFERILGWYVLGEAVFTNAVGQLALEQPLVYSWPEPLPSWPVCVQLAVGIAGIGIALCGLPAANRSFDDLADATLRAAERSESELHRNSRS